MTRLTKEREQEIKKLCNNWNNESAYVLSYCCEELLAELDVTREELTKYKNAMLADIRDAGPMTGPIYHSNIRKALDMPAEGSGPDIIQPCPYPAEEGCEDCQKETL